MSKTHRKVGKCERQRMLTVFPPRTAVKVLHAPGSVRVMIEPAGMDSAWALEFDEDAWRRLLANEAQAMSMSVFAQNAGPGTACTYHQSLFPQQKRGLTTQ